MNFEWDEKKAEANERKHGLDFLFVLRVFLDPWVEDFDVSRPQDGELRRKATGKIEGQIYTLVYTVRGDRIRVISARRANVQEERRYGDRHLQA